MSNLSEETVQALVTSLLPILITVLFAWLSSRNDQSKRRQLIDDAKQRIELISAYVSAQGQVLDDPAQLERIKGAAAGELYEIKAFMDDKLQSMEKSTEKSESYFQRFFLLYRMRSGLASFFRLGFFGALALSILWTIFLFDPADVQELGLMFSIAMYIALSLPPLLVALFLRWLALRFDRPPQAAPSAQAPA